MTHILADMMEFPIGKKLPLWLVGLTYYFFGTFFECKEKMFEKLEDLNNEQQ